MKRLLVVLFLLAPAMVFAQRKEKKEIDPPVFNIKTNLLYDLTTTMNLGIEFRTGGHTSIDIPVNWNPWDFKNTDFQLKHVLVQPEFRYWFRETFKGGFIGLHAHWATFNVGGFPHKPFTKFMENNRFDGELYGAGISWGYRWNWSHHWGMEFTIGAGYALMDYDVYACETCGDYRDSRKHGYWGPTKIGLNLIYGIGRKPVEPEPEPVVIVVERYEPQFRVSYITPEVEAVKARAESGKAYLEYVVGRSEINRDFRSNAAELEAIKKTIDLVKNDTDVTVKSVQLTGHASPEGSASSNQRLSQRRAEALRSYIQANYGLAANLISAVGAGEDWKTLETLVQQGTFAGKEELIDIIAYGNDNLDSRETQLRGKSAYQTIRNELYPKLRRTDYVINYEVAPIDVERAKEIIRTRPSNLSLNEMFMVANSYAQGSEQFRESMETAARVFPDSDVANLNAAASALDRKDTVAAERYLAKVKNHDGAWHTNMGILMGLKGDTVKAAEHFRSAGSAAGLNAEELRKHVESITVFE